MVNMMSRKQFKHLTLAEKVELITNSDGRTGTSLAEQYGVSRATVHNVLKRKVELLQSYEANVPAERKRRNACRFELVNEFVWSWLRSSNVPVSGPTIKEKALDYARLQGLDEFKASNGWLDRFKFRHNVNCAMLCSKDAAARSSARYDSTMSRSKRKVLASIDVLRRLKKGKMDGALDTQSEEIKPSMDNSEQLTENKDESCLQCSNDTSGLELHNQEMDSVNSVPLVMPESDAISSPLRENDVQGSHSVKETDDPVETSETISKPNGTRQTYIIYHKLPSSQMSNTNLQPVEDRTKVVCETHRKIKVEENVTDISRESIKSKAPQTTKSQDTVRVKSEPPDLTEESTSSVMDEVDKGDEDQSELKISSVETMSSEKSYDSTVKENGQNYAADVMDEFLGIMGMDKLDDTEKEDIGHKIQTQKINESVRSVPGSGKDSDAGKKRDAAPGTTAPTKPKSKSQHKCIVCGKIGKCKYNIVRNGDVKHLCNDTCFKTFRASPSIYLQNDSTVPEEPATTDIPVPVTQGALVKLPIVKMPVKMEAVVDPNAKRCGACSMILPYNKNYLVWQTVTVCSEGCLGKVLARVDPLCANCSCLVPDAAKLTHCLPNCDDIRQCCTQACSDSYAATIKMCAFCQKDLTSIADSFVAPVTDGTTFHDFCSPDCHNNFENRASSLGSSLKTTPSVEKDEKDTTSRRTRSTSGLASCSTCNKVLSVKHEITFENKLHKLCSGACFAAFRYAKKMSCNLCDNCSVPTTASAVRAQFEGFHHKFCSSPCLIAFKNQYKKTVPCTWCASKRFNFDMIERYDIGGKFQPFCSLNCISLYRVNIQASSNKSVKCDQCGKHVPAQYHLTMSDASVRNFCAYACVMTFQNQFKTKPPLNAATQKNVQQPGAQRAGQTQPIRGQLQTKQYVQAGQRPSVPSQQAMAPIQSKSSTALSFPVIANVMSLAPKGNAVSQSPAMKTVTTPALTNAPRMSGPVKKEIMIQHPPAVSMSNKAVLCKAFCQTKATTCRPHSVTKSTQTESTGVDKIVIPFPVPIYVPVPLAMYTTPTPFIVPVPIPVPVPCFIPTGKASAEQILEQIKGIRDRIPNDPFEAELLMMAEAVADQPSSGDFSPVKAICPDADDKYDMTSRNGDVTSQHTFCSTSAVRETALTTTSGDGMTDGDMIEMALKMAAEMSEPVADLETSLDNMIAQAAETLAEADARRGTKRQTRGRLSRGRSKKPRLDAEEPEPEPVPATPLTPPAADANALLKFTYGVNAWKHWVRNKNIQLEKASKQNPRIRLFKTDLLECSADELNYSLCLFVKEVRKPNGEYYAPDSIYYLCLGVQQFLYMNGRADNIFTDIYYEKFTECLNEIMTRFQPRVSPNGELLSRISEDQLWETKQLGAHSPHVLLNTLIYFNTRFFRLKTAENHLKLAFSHVLKAWKRNPGSTRTVYLRYFAPPPDGSRKGTDDVFEQTENTHNPLRCPVKLFDFYVSKCPESIRSRNDLFYLMPESSCVPDSSVWYSTVPLGVDAMSKMLYRIKLVKEVQEADEVTESD